jgi:hypothetical protein
VTNRHNINDAPIIVNLIDNSVVANPGAILVGVALEFDAVSSTWLLARDVKTGKHPLQQLRG